MPRPYRIWAYPVPPLIYLGVTAFMMIYLVLERPQHSLASVALMAVGLIVYSRAPALTTRAESRAVDKT